MQSSHDALDAIRRFAFEAPSEAFWPVATTPSVVYHSNEWEIWHKGAGEPYPPYYNRISIRSRNAPHVVSLVFQSSFLESRASTLIPPDTLRNIFMILFDDFGATPSGELLVDEDYCLRAEAYTGPDSQEVQPSFTPSLHPESPNTFDVSVVAERLGQRSLMDNEPSGSSTATPDLVNSALSSVPEPDAHFDDVWVFPGPSSMSRRVKRFRFQDP